MKYDSICLDPAPLIGYRHGLDTAQQFSVLVFSVILFSFSFSFSFSKVAACQFFNSHVKQNPD